MARRGPADGFMGRTRPPHRRRGSPAPIVVGAVVVVAGLVVLVVALGKKPGPAPPTAPITPRAPAAPDAEFEIGWDEEDVSDAATAGRGESIWIEGESSRRHDFRKHSWYDRVKKNVLSGTDWLSHYSGEGPGEAAYDFEVKDGGEYAFWMRLNPFKVKMSYQLDGGRRVDIDTGKVRDRLMISQKPDHRYIAWASAGRVKLRPGRHTVKVRVDGEIRHSGGVDCLTLTKDRTFVPLGVTRPGEVAALETGPADWFPVIVDDDRFSERSVIDMTSLVHRPAGKYGFLRRKGKALVFSKRPDVPVKFWGVGANIDDKLSPGDETQRVRYLVKHGVNMARQHSVLGYLGPLKGGRFDAKKMDSYDRWFAELKKHGIYVTWSVFYPLRISAADDLFTGLDPLSQDFTGGGWDEKALKGNLQTPMEVLAVGRVTVSFDGRQSERFDWDKCWDKGRGTVRSVTGEHAWDMSRRVVTITSPKTQAVIGFAGGAAYDLPGVKVYVKTPFVSLIFTPLDDRPLVDSKHILITAMSKDKQTGTEYAGNGTNLRVVGGPPLLMEPVMAKIRLEGEAPRSVEVLDFYGVPTGRRLGIKGGEFAISGRYRTYYYEVKR